MHASVPEAIATASGTAAGHAAGIGLAGDLAAFLTLLHRASSGEWLQAVEELDLSLTGLKILHRLDDAGELSVKELATLLPLSLPAASRAVDGLVGRGLLERRESTEDRRSRLVRLSPAGHAMAARVLEARLAGLEGFVAALPEEDRDRLSHALSPIVERTRRRP